MKTLAISGMSLLFWAQTAWGLIDMKNANFAEAFVDMTLPGSGYDLRVQRAYNSRSLFNGILGFGQCTDFETDLDHTPEGYLRLSECGGGLRITFKPKGASTKDTEKAIEQIISKEKGKRKRMSKKEVTDLRTKLKHDPFLRQEYSNLYDIKGHQKGGVAYYADGRENESIVFKDKQYKRSLPDGTFQIFDLKGKLIQMYDRNANYLKLSYNKDQLVQVIDNNGRKLEFKYYSENNKVRYIKGPKGIKAEYWYDGEDLVKVKDMNGLILKYTYDDFHNMTRVDFPDKTYATLSYNTNKDWVMSYRNRKGCIETYDYTTNEKNPLNHYWSKVIKKCGKKVTNRSSYEFLYKYQDPKKKLGRYLYRVHINNNGNVTSYIYHKVFGKPVSIARNKLITSYKYYKNGFISEKSEPLRITKYNYKNSCNKVSDVKVTYFSLQQRKPGSKDTKYRKKKVKTVATQFNYERPKCNLITAKNSEGQRIKLSYDHRGRISKIVDQSKKSVTIKYDSRFGKPQIVSRPGLGTIKVLYKSNGEIDKVESKEGPTVAVQVASVFNNLLEIISPATSELSI